MIKTSGTDKPLVLIVDDPYRSLRPLERLISSQDFSAVWAPDETSGLEILRNQAASIRIVIIDLKSSGMGGGGFLLHARNLAPHAAVLISAPLGPFLYQGGNFYEFIGSGLKQEINSILLSINQMTQNRQHFSGRRQPGLEVRQRFGPIIGCSPGINAIYRLIESLKHSNSTVLIQGESGTGKELIAQAIHSTGSRGKGPFVAINCGAIPANLMESELFGHERGAFTNAVSLRIGKFEAARGGTLFLDEIGELDRSLQVKLLRVLQEKEFQRVGGNRTYAADVRIIAASTRNLKEAVQAGHFRDDLFYRLNVIPVRVPPLRKRREDIPLLLAHFFRKAAEEMRRPVPALSAEARQSLIAYRYPGNVRELANIVERLMVTCSSGRIAMQDLPGPVRGETGEGCGPAELLNRLPPDGLRLDQVERELIRKTLETTSGNKAAAARMLGITRRRLYLRLAQYGSQEYVTCSYTTAPN